VGWGDGGDGNYYCTNPNPPPQYFPSYSSWQPSANVIQSQQPTIHPREGQILRARDRALKEEEGDKTRRPAGGTGGTGGRGRGLSSRRRTSSWRLLDGHLLAWTLDPK
jgi:hypothetical protein